MDVSRNINVIGPTGEMGSVPPSELDKYLNSGFRRASSSDIEAHLEKEEFGTIPQQALGAAEQALSAATLHGSDILATKTGFSTSEEREARARQLGTPLEIGAQALGLGASALLVPGEGAVGILSKVGQLTSKAVGLGEAAGTAARIGSAAIKAGAENAFYQATGELSDAAVRELEDKPQQSLMHSIANTGLAFAIGAPFGAGLGAVHPLWEASQKSGVGQFLKGLQEKLGGTTNPAISSAEETLLKAGVSFSPEAAAVISRDPAFERLAQPLLDSQTHSGKNFQEAIQKSKSEVGSSLLESVGRTADDMEKLTDFSERKAGEELQSKLVEQIRREYEPIKKTYDSIADKYSKAEFNAGDRAVLAENLAQKALEEGWVLRPSSPEAKFMSSALKEISVIDNLNKLRTFESSLASEAASMDRYDIAKQVRELFGNAEDAFVKLRLSSEAPELLAKHEKVSADYKALKGTINELSDRLKPGKSSGPETFLYKLQDMVPEQVLNRLAQRNDASFIEFLNKNFPDVQKAVNDYQLNKILKASSTKMGDIESINPTAFFKKIKTLSPELREAILPKASQPRIQALAEVWEGLNHIPRNYSNTAATLDKMWRYKTAAVMAMIYDLAKKSPIVGALIGHLGEKVSRDVPDAVRLGLLKFLASNKEVHASGLKAAIEFIDHSIKGENLVRKSIKNLFRAGQITLPSGVIPSEKDRKKLEKIVEAYEKDPEQMMNVGGNLGHYFEAQATSQAQLLLRTITALKSLRPTAEKISPLDTEPKIPKMAQTAYHRILDIAEQPLMVLQYIKDGTLQPKDMAVLNTIHPEAYTSFSEKIMEEMAAHLADGGKIPYTMRQSLSLFMGQPLDSTLTPQSILSNQSTFTPESSPAPSKKVPENSLKKIASMDSTPLQKREAAKVTG